MRVKAFSPRVRNSLARKFESNRYLIGFSSVMGATCAINQCCMVLIR
jgi:hypothetical protein